MEVGEIPPESGSTAAGAMANLLTRPWSADGHGAGVIYVELADGRRCMIAIDEGREVDDRTVDAITGHIVRLHNAGLAAATSQSRDPDDEHAT